MEKLGKILLFILNVFIDVFLIGVTLLMLLWIIKDVSPTQVVQKTFTWMEQTWDSLTGQTSKERGLLMSDELRKKAHRQIYVQEPSKYDEKGRITQPYKYE